MIWVFFISTSVSMNRYFSGQFTYLESAKAGIEHLLKIERTPLNQNNTKYILITYEDYPECYKAIVNVGLVSDFLASLKNLEATDIPKAGMSFAAIFGYLDSLFHKQYFETMGRGRYPGNIEMVTIVWFTDGEKYVEPHQRLWDVTEELHIPGHRLPVKDIFYEPFRWNQTLNTIYMAPEASEGNPKIREMSDAMGGVYTWANSLSGLLHTIEGYVGYAYKMHPSSQPLHEGVIVTLSEYGKEAPDRLKIYSSASSPSLFPIPEPCWINDLQPNPLSKTIELPMRTAHPVIVYIKKDVQFYIPENFPIDRLPVSSNCKVVRELIAKQPLSGWQLYVQGSHSTQGLGAPFGLLKYNPVSRVSSIYLMPYDFPKLFSLIRELEKAPSDEVPPNVQKAFLSYLHSIPSYYKEPLNRALQKCNLSHLWPSGDLTSVDLQIVEYGQSLVETARRELNIIQHAKISKRSKSSCSFMNSNEHNIFDINRSQILSVLFNLQENFLKKFISDNELINVYPLLDGEKKSHSIPIVKMGDYTAKMTAMQVLRNPFDDEEAARQKERNIFGNRYRRMEKTLKIDEQDEDRGMEYQETLKDVNPRLLSSESRLWKRTSSTFSLLPPLCTWYKTVVVTPIPTVLPWKTSSSDEGAASRYYTTLAENATKRFNGAHANDSVSKEEFNDDSNMSGIVGSKPPNIEKMEKIEEDSIELNHIQDNPINPAITIVTDENVTDNKVTDYMNVDTKDYINTDVNDIFIDHSMKEDHWKFSHNNLSDASSIKIFLSHPSPALIQEQVESPTSQATPSIPQDTPQLQKLPLSLLEAKEKIYNLIRVYPRDYSESKLISFVKEMYELSSIPVMKRKSIVEFAAEVSLKFNRYTAYSSICNILQNKS